MLLSPDAKVEYLPADFVRPSKPARRPGRIFAEDWAQLPPLSVPGVEETLRLLQGAKRNGSPHRLKQEGRKVTFEAESLDGKFKRAVACKCKSWLCPDCRKQKGGALREAMLDHASLFKLPMLFTITVNREWFSSPEESYSYIMGEKFIARLLTKELGVRRWIVTIQQSLRLLLRNHGARLAPRHDF